MKIPFMCKDMHINLSIAGMKNNIKLSQTRINPCASMCVCVCVGGGGGVLNSWGQCRHS